MVEGMVEGSRSRERKCKNCGESRRKEEEEEIGLALIASVHGIGQGQEEEDQRKRTTVTQIERRDERKMKAWSTLTNTSEKPPAARQKTNYMGYDLIDNL